MVDKQKTKAEKLRALQERYARELPSRFEELQHEWQTNKSTAGDSTFYRHIHSMAGSAGTFGFMRLGERARELEQLLKQCNESPEKSVANKEIDQSLSELLTISMNGSEQLEATADLSLIPTKSASVEDSFLVYLLEDDINLADEIAQQLMHFEYRVETFHDATALHEGVARQVPDVLLADIHLPEGPDAGPQAATELSRGSAREVPVIFISGHDAWQDRLNAVRAGGQAYLSKPINFSLLLEQLDAVLETQKESYYRIVLVDDTELLAEHYADCLQAAGMETLILNDPSSLLNVLPDFRPDLVLMDIYMPGCSGVEAATVIRQHSGYTNLPIVYLSTEKGLQQQLEALTVGGDEFLHKPISDTHLVTAVQIRAQRFRDLTALMNRDSLTGLLNHINLKLTLEREISQARRRSSLLCFIMLDIDRFKSINDSYGHPVGDRVIKTLARLLSQRLRKGDVVARYGGEEFAVILPDTPIENARNLIDELRKQFEQITYPHENRYFNVTFSAGIASCPPHKDMEGIIVAADTALYQAKHRGRNQVVQDEGALVSEKSG